LLEKKGRPRPRGELEHMNCRSGRFVEGGGQSVERTIERSGLARTGQDEGAKDRFGGCYSRLSILASLAAKRIAIAMDGSDEPWPAGVVAEHGPQVSDQAGEGGLRNKRAGPQHAMDLILGESAGLSGKEKAQKFIGLRLE
jgi:hypothetical protein